MKLIFATDYKTRGGASYKAGSTHEVNDNEARALLINGIARREDSPAAGKTTDKKGA